MNDGQSVGTRAAPAQREAALALHRAGNFAEAEAAYLGLLEARPGDSDLLGLLGVLAMQQGHGSRAEELFSAAMAAPGDPRVHLRNLNNFLVLLGQQTRGDDSRALAARPIPAWPAGIAPDAAERRTLLSLAEALLRLGQAAAGLRLLGDAMPDLNDDSEALILRGRLHFETGTAGCGLSDFDRAAALAPDDLRPLAGRAAVLARQGEPGAGRAAAQEIGGRYPFHAEPGQAGQAATILVLNPAPDRIPDPALTRRGLHFSVNYPAQFVTQLARRYRFVSVLDTVPADAAPWRDTGAVLAINNLVNAEGLNVRGRYEAARALADRTGLPVINHPEQARRTTRQMNAETARRPARRLGAEDRPLPARQRPGRCDRGRYRPSLPLSCHPAHDRRPYGLELGDRGRGAHRLARRR